jgi:hypothetical protein
VLLAGEDLGHGEDAVGLEGRLHHVAVALVKALFGRRLRQDQAGDAARARARLGQTDRALALLGRYPVTAGQRRFTDVMHAIQARLRLGRISPQDAANELEDAQRDQDRWNIAHSLNLDIPFQDKCGASFWWRYADTPCNASAKPAGGVVW